MALPVKPAFALYKPAASLAPTNGKGVLVGVCETTATPLESITEAALPFVAGTNAGTTLPVAASTIFSNGGTTQGLAFVSGNKEARPAYTVPVGNVWTMGVTVKPTSVGTACIPVSLGSGGPAICFNSTLYLMMSGSVTAFSPTLSLANGTTYTIIMTSNGTTVTAYLATWSGTTYTQTSGTITVNATCAGQAFVAINSRQNAGYEFIGTMDSAFYVDGVCWSSANVTTFLSDPYAIFRAADGSALTPGQIRPVPTINGLTLYGDGIQPGSLPTQGGTGPRTYQWSTSTGPTSTFTNIAGATGRNLVLTGQPRRTYAYYKRTANDVASNTITTVAYPASIRPAYKIGVVLYGDSYTNFYDATTFAATVRASAENANIFASVTVSQNGFSGYTSQQLTYGYTGVGSGAWAGMVSNASTALASCDDLWLLFRETINDAVHNVSVATHLANIQNIIAQATTPGAFVAGKTARVLLLDSVPLITELTQNPDADNTEIEAYRAIEQTVVDGLTVFRASPAAWQFFSNSANHYRQDGVHLSDAADPSPTGTTDGFTMLANVDAMEFIRLIVEDTIATSTSGGIFRGFNGGFGG